MPRRMEKKATGTRESIYRASSIAKGWYREVMERKQTAEDLNRHRTGECLELGKKLMEEDLPLLVTRQLL